MTHTITGSNFTGFTRSASGDASFKAFSPAENKYLEGDFHQATEAEMEQALNMAHLAFPAYQSTTYEARALFLEAIAAEIMALGDDLIERCVAETALPAARIMGERARTCGQLAMFARLLQDGWWADARIDKAQPDRKPLPKPDIRRMLIPLGPVAVFGASNFPLAFSTCGGDTASALAAGCPVVVKAHSSHPGTNELVATAIIRAAQQTGMPEGVFSSLYLSHDNVLKLVRHPVVRAVGFTGSRKVGMTLFNTAVNRPDPIPVYAEMSSINPVILFEGAFTAGEKIARELAASVSLGAGQFCTNPGLIIMMDSEACRGFLPLFATALTQVKPASMLNKNIHKAYLDGLQSLQASSAVTLLAASSQPAKAERHEAHAIVHTIKAEAFLNDRKFSEEVFGPASLVILCQDKEELRQVVSSLEGQLTATIHATEADEEVVGSVLQVITEKAGRVIYGGYPTGVEVCHSMQHGGPFPSTTDARSTSVGTAAIYRFVRPVAYQDFPDHLLPDLLKNGNPLQALRLVDGAWSSEKIGHP